MSERMKRVFIGAASGLVTGLAMKFLKSGGHLAGVSINVRTILAGCIAGLFYLTITICMRLLKGTIVEKAQG